LAAIWSPGSYSQLLQRKLKRQKREIASEQQDVYLNLDMLPGTSVNCERLFSNAKFILSDTRKRTTPSLVEALLLLKVNRSYWNVYSVGKAMGQTIGVDEEGVASDEDLD
jgi:NAD dependent epimerase/dehydratase family enzyme